MYSKSHYKVKMLWYIRRLNIEGSVCEVRKWGNIEIHSWDLHFMLYESIPRVWTWCINGRQRASLSQRLPACRIFLYTICAITNTRCAITWKSLAIFISRRNIYTGKSDCWGRDKVYGSNTTTMDDFSRSTRGMWTTGDSYLSGRGNSHDCQSDLSNFDLGSSPMSQKLEHLGDHENKEKANHPSDNSSIDWRFKINPITVRGKGVVRFSKNILDPPPFSLFRGDQFVLLLLT